MRNPFYRFLLQSSALFLIWYVSYEFYLRDHTLIDEFVIDHLAGVAEFVLRFLGYTLTEYPGLSYRNHIGIEGAPGVMIGAACDGLVLFALFIVFIVSFPGQWKHRAWFIPMGLLIIHYLNALRIVALTIIISWNQSWLSFNHDYTFTIIVYSIVFGLWWVWVKHFSTIPTASQNQSHE